MQQSFNISDALGTERQFMPRPDGDYIERLNGLNAMTAGKPDTSNAEQAAKSLDALTSALTNFQVDENKRQEEWANEVATRLVNSHTPEEIVKMNMIDAAQQAGYVDITANPYFQAVASKTQGKVLNSLLDNKYHELYDNTPAKSAEEEQARYNQFMQDSMKDYIKSSPNPINQTAFGEGFNEANLVTLVQAGKNYVQKQTVNGQQEVLAHAVGTLDKLAVDYPNLPKNALTWQTQAVFNDVRLASLPTEARIKIATNFAQNLLSTGRITYDKFKQMADNVTIATNTDGSEQKMSDVLPMFGLKNATVSYLQQYQDKVIRAQKDAWIKAKDEKKVTSDLDALQEKDPDKYRELYPAGQQAIAAIKLQKREDEIKAMEKARLAARQQMMMAKANNGLGNVLAFVNGRQFDHNGQIAGSLSLGADQSAVFAQAKNIIEQKYAGSPMLASKLVKLLNAPNLIQAKRAYQAQLNSTLSSISDDTMSDYIDGDGKIINSTLETWIGAYQRTGGAIRTAIGNKAFAAIAAIVNLSGVTGSMQTGLQRFAQWNNLTDADKSLYNDKVGSMAMNDYINVTTVSGEPQSISTAECPKVGSLVKQLAAILCSSGTDANEAVYQAADAVTNNMLYYHGAIMPRYAFSGDNEALGAVRGQVFDQFAYNCSQEATGSPAYASDVDVEYTNDGSLIFKYGDVVDKYSPALVMQYLQEVVNNGGSGSADTSTTASDTLDFDIGNSVFDY